MGGDTEDPFARNLLTPFSRDAHSIAHPDLINCVLAVFALMIIMYVADIPLKSPVKSRNFKAEVGTRQSLTTSAD